MKRKYFIEEISELGPKLTKYNLSTDQLHFMYRKNIKSSIFTERYVFCDFE